MVACGNKHAPSYIGSSELVGLCQAAGTGRGHKSGVPGRLAGYQGCAQGSVEVTKGSLQASIA